MPRLRAARECGACQAALVVCCFCLLSSGQSPDNLKINQRSMRKTRIIGVMTFKLSRRPFILSLSVCQLSVSMSHNVAYVNFFRPRQKAAIRQRDRPRSGSYEG